jgi:hypothetical protein
MTGKQKEKLNSWLCVKERMFKRSIDEHTWLPNSKHLLSTYCMPGPVPVLKKPPVHHVNRNMNRLFTGYCG